jgi:hypothetical protein
MPTERLAVKIVRGRIDLTQEALRKLFLASNIASRGLC